MSDLTSSGSEEQDQFSSVLLLGTNCPFAKLPIELQFKCLNYASPSTIFRLGLTNQFFRSLVTSSEICKSRVKRLWESYGDGKSDERIFETVDGNEQYEDWDEVWSFLVSHEHYLGRSYLLCFVDKYINEVYTRQGGGRQRRRPEGN